MAKKIALIGLMFLLVAGVLFMMNRRSHMLNAGSQGTEGALAAVSVNGTPLPELSFAGNLPANTAQQVSGDLLVTLTINPYPPIGGGPVDFVVNLTGANGKPVDDANIILDLKMPEMFMPPNQMAMSSGDAGNYQSTGYFTMRGLWRIEVIINRGGQSESVFFDVGV